MQQLSKAIVLAPLLFLAPVDLRSEEALPGALEAGWQGEKVCELLQEDDMTRVLRCTFPPGVGHERHYHPAHFGYTLKGGSMRIIDDSGEREFTGRANTSWQSEGVAWHHVVNVGDTTTQYLIVEQKY